MAEWTTSVYQGDFKVLYHAGVYLDKNGRTSQQLYCVECINCGNISVRSKSKIHLSSHCYCKKRRHGMHNTSIYHTWEAMIQRCKNPNSQSYSRYGARGIKVCKRWLKFENFYEDMGPRPINRSIERINNDGNYEPNNCRWATAFEQSINKSNTKLTALDVRFIRELFFQGFKDKVVAKMFGLSKRYVNHLRNNKSWVN